MSKTDTNPAFDAHGNLLYADDGRGRTTYAYDADGRLTTAIYPGAEWMTLRYDDAGNVTERRTASGARAQFGYDAAGRIKQADYSRQTALHYQHDDAGRMTEARTPDCVTRYTYDAAGRPITCEQEIGHDALKTMRAELAYNAAGHLAGVRVGGFERWLRYAYDDQQRLVSLGYESAAEGFASGDASAATALIRLEYVEANLQVLMHYANAITQTIALDERGQVTRICAASSANESLNESLFHLRYRSGDLGNIVALNDARFIYDDQQRLVQQGALLGDWSRYAYDAAGNRLELKQRDGTCTRYEYDAAGRLIHCKQADATTRHTYDRDGNLTARMDGGAAWTYAYDGAGRLTTVQRQGIAVASYGYDHAGRCVFKRAGAEAVHTLRDPWGNALAEWHSDGELRIFVGIAGQHLACLDILDGQAHVLYLHPDHIGSVRAITDAQGQVLARCDCDPFGNCNARPTSKLLAELCLFAGHPFDAETGLYDFGVRWYDPTLGRFISADSFTFSADDPRLLWSNAPPEARRKLRDEKLRSWQRGRAHRNRYVYALNNPMTFVDRDGHSAGLYFLYTLAALFWALPYTLVGFLFFEVVLNWLTFAWLWDWGDHAYKGESSDRLGAWAWWVLGGLSGKLVIGGGAFTLGNYVIGNADTINGLNTTTKNFGIPTHHDELSASPFDPNTLLNERESVAEHELRHTNQYGWWGPFMMPWVLVLYFLFQNVVLQGVGALAKKDIHVRWKTIWDGLTANWWNGVIAGVGALLLPGSYWWDYIGRGGYASSWFEQNAAQWSGSANEQDVRASADHDSVAASGTAIVTVISRSSRVGSLTLSVTTNASGGATVTDITPGPVSNLKVFRYTAGANASTTDVLTAGDGSSSFTVEIKIT